MLGTPIGWHNTISPIIIKCLLISKIQQEMFDVEKTIELLNKAIEDKLQPMKVAHTRLQARTNRPHLEKCRDEAQHRSVVIAC